MTPHERASCRWGTIMAFILGACAGIGALTGVLDTTHKLCHSTCVELDTLTENVP